MTLYRRSLRYFKADRRLVAALLGTIALQTALSLIAAWPMAILVDSVLTLTPNTTGIHHLFLTMLPHSQVHQVIALAVATLLFKLIGDLLTMTRNLLTNHINYNGLMRVRCDLFRKLQALHLHYHRNQPQGDALYRLTNDTLGPQAILQTVISTGVAVVTLVVMAIILGTRSLPLTTLALSITPLLAAANVYYGRRLKQESLACKDRDAEFTTAAQRSLSQIALVQAFGRESDEFTSFRGSITKCIHAWFKLHWQEVAYWLIVGTILGLGGSLVFGYGGYLVWRDQFAPNATHHGMTLGDLLVFTSYLGLLWDPLCKLTGAGATMQNAAAGAERVFEILDRDIEITDCPMAVSLPRQARTLTLRNLHFAYNHDTSKKILNGLDVCIHPGQMVAFVGASGVGKSTLLNLLPRFYDPTAGSLQLDGIDACNIKIADLRRHIALVLQESVLLPTTVAENIAYGRPGVPMAEIRAAAELAGAAEFIEKLPQGYQTLLTENAANLSGGQRQRISIARALLTNAPIMILDEPTSALDPHHERVVTERLKQMKGTRTIILVSHRLSTVTDCDQIFMMEAGRIVEQGTHLQLMALRGKYHAMFTASEPAPPIEALVESLQSQVTLLETLLHPAGRTAPRPLPRAVEPLRRA
ncbi:MAG: ABC transporter ATP-binding protein [Phycisphaerae bacterium]